jgi:hypothetical protein
LGAALLIRCGSLEADASRFEAVANAFPRRVRGMESRDVAGAHVRGRVWSHRSNRGSGVTEDPATGSWLALVGNPTRADLGELNGEEMGQRLLEGCLVQGPAALASLSPPFAAVFFDARAGRTHVTTDRLGFQHLYLLREPGSGVWLSSSSLALARSFATSLDTEAAAEWLAIGHFVSQRTFFHGISKLGCGERLEVEVGEARTLGEWEPTERAWGGEDALDAFVEAFLSAVESCAQGPGIASELTAGIDSRLVLAALLRLELPFLSWTVAQPRWDELRTIAQLRRHVDFPHYVAEVGPDFAGRLPELVLEMHELADGESNALSYAHLLVAFEQLEGRRDVSISGTAGEIARGFYYSVLGAQDRNVRGVSLESVVSKTTRPTRPLHGRFRSEVMPDPPAAAADVLRTFIEKSPCRSPVGILEDLYLRGRLQRFAGRNFTMTGHFCRQALPYFDNALVELVMALPTETKRDGWVVRKALRQLSPTLASVPLTAGAPVEPSTSKLNLAASFRRSLALGRRAAARYGGPMGRRMLGRSIENLPGRYARESTAFRDFASDLLLSPDAKLEEYIEPVQTRAVMDRALAGGSLFPLGLLLTLELTLRTVQQGIDA